MDLVVVLVLELIVDDWEEQAAGHQEGGWLTGCQKNCVFCKMSEMLKSLTTNQNSQVTLFQMFSHVTVEILSTNMTMEASSM